MDYIDNETCRTSAGSQVTPLGPQTWSKGWELHSTVQHTNVKVQHTDQSPHIASVQYGVIDLFAAPLQLSDVLWSAIPAIMRE